MRTDEMLRSAPALERNTGLLIFGILVVSSIGGLVQVLPTIVDDSLSTPAANVVPHTPLELVGRDIYIRESCSTCHSQQVRPLLAEVKRYGQYAGSGEFAYERPFLWGSKRTGPDLLRVGGKYTDAWHRLHMTDPRAVVPASIMPNTRGSQSAPPMTAPSSLVSMHCARSAIRTPTKTSKAPQPRSQARRSSTGSSHTCSRSGKHAAAAADAHGGH